MRRSKWPLVLAVSLMAFGIAGFVVTVIITGSSAPSRYGALPGFPLRGGDTDFDGYASNGERIYYTGVGHDGVISVQWGITGRGGMMGRGRGAFGGSGMVLGCVDCHGADGRGGAFGMMWPTVRVPDIRYSTLVGPHEGSDGSEPGWSDAEIADAIRSGREPDGSKLDAVMPRWDMDETDMSDTIDYLKELSGR